MLILLVLAGCAPALHTRRTTPVVVEQLFFGRRHQGELVVTDSAWARFLRDEVTPRFPAGLTVLSGRGQWRNGAGAIEQEESFVLELVHPASRQADSSIVAIIDRYKVLFHQESVLRLIVPGKAVF